MFYAHNIWFCVPRHIDAHPILSHSIWFCVLHCVTHPFFWLCAEFCSMPHVITWVVCATPAMVIFGAIFLWLCSTAYFWKGSIVFTLGTLRIRNRLVKTIFFWYGSVTRTNSVCDVILWIVWSVHYTFFANDSTCSNFPLSFFKLDIVLVVDLPSCSTEVKARIEVTLGSLMNLLCR